MRDVGCGLDSNVQATTDAPFMLSLEPPGTFTGIDKFTGIYKTVQTTTDAPSQVSFPADTDVHDQDGALA